MSLDLPFGLHRTQRRWTLLFGALGLAAASAQAQNRENFVGLSVLGQSAVVRDADTRVTLLPAFRYDRFFLEGGMLGMDVAAFDGLRLTAGLLVANDGFYPKDAPALAGLTERDPRGYLALGANYSLPMGQFAARLAGDVSNKSKGVRARLGYQLPLQFGNATVLPGVGLDVFDRKEAAYLYGVSSQEVAPGRSAYAPGGGVNPYLSLAGVVRLGGPHALTGFVQASALDSRFKDSPIVSESTQTSLGLGYQYRF
jgi:MipA family protein